jgi:outer membrane protein assembly factor BamB
MLQRITAQLLVIFFLFSVSTVLGADWTELQKDPAREGYMQDRINLPIKEAFKYSAGDSLSGTLTIINNEIGYTTLNGSIGLISLVDGKEIWKRNFPEKFTSGMIASESEFFVVTETGNVMALSKNNGAVLWTLGLGYTVKAPMAKYFRYLYVLGEDGAVACLNAFDGKVLWTNTIMGTLLTAPAMKQNNIYMISKQGRLFCLDAYNGRTRWVFEMDSSSQSSPIPSTEILVIGDDDGNVYGIDYIKGTSYYKQSIEHPVTTPFAYGYFDKRMLVAGSGSTYTAFGTSNGKPMWSYKVDKAVIPPIGAGDKIWFPGSKHTLIAADAFAGTKAIEMQLDSNISAAIAMSNGRIAVGTEMGTIYVFCSKENDYSIQIKPDIGVMIPGQVYSFQILVSADSNFNDNITFTVGGFPCSCKGVGRYFDRTTINSAGKLNLVIDTTEDASPERFRVNVSAYSQSGVKREASSLLVIQPSLDINILEFGPIQAVQAGQDFSVDLFIKDAVNVRSVLSKIRYPSDYLFLHRVEAGKFFGADAGAYFFDWSKDDASGTALIGLTKKDIGAPGSGTVARLHFRAKKPADIELFMEQTSVRDSFLQEVAYQTKKIDVALVPGKQKIIQLSIAKPSIIIDNAQYTLDAPPFIQQGRTLVPIRRIAEEMEALVSWEPIDQKVTLSRYDKVIELWIGRPRCKVNSLEKNLPSNVAPLIHQQRTYLPLRFVAEELDGIVEWFADTQTIKIIYPGY